MRVISGDLKGRVIKGFNIIGTRPTKDRVKESLFAIIQNKILNSTVLDLFSGSGNLGIEAISNGAKLCYFNDINKDCIKIIEENITNFNIGNKAVVLNKDWLQCLNYLNASGTKMDIVFLDPPYKMECLNEVIEKIIKDNLMNDDGIIVCEVSHDYLQVPLGWTEIKNKKYGDKEVVIYKKK